MKHYISTAFCLLLGLCCTADLSVQAAYTSPDEIAMSLRAMSGGCIPEGNVHQICISPEDASQGTSVHFGLYFETDPSIVDISYISAALECETVIFDRNTFQNPTNYAYTQAEEFTHTDGITYSSKFRPYCFGRINSSGKYEHGASSCMHNIKENSMILTWTYDYNNYDENGQREFSTKFFGDQSDSYSFIEFDVQIPPDTPPGIYPVRFVTKDSFISGSTYLSSDVSVPDENNPGKYISHYSNIVPALYGADIIVAGENPVSLTEIPSVFRYAEDTEPFSLQEFPGALTMFFDGASGAAETESLLDVFETGSPADRAVTVPVTLRSELSFDGKSVQTVRNTAAALEYHIGLKGDANEDGSVNSEDAALVLRYAADKGSGSDAAVTGTPGTEEEDFALFLADTDENSAVNAQDAARILQYAARKGSGENPDWNDIP